MASKGEMSVEMANSEAICRYRARILKHLNEFRMTATPTGTGRARAVKLVICFLRRGCAGSSMRRRCVGSAMRPRCPRSSMRPRCPGNSIRRKCAGRTRRPRSRGAQGARDARVAQELRAPGVAGCTRAHITYMAPHVQATTKPKLLLSWPFYGTFSSLIPLIRPASCQFGSAGADIHS